MGGVGTGFWPCRCRYYTSRKGEKRRKKGNGVLGRRVVWIGWGRQDRTEQVVGEEGEGLLESVHLVCKCYVRMRSLIWSN